MAQAALAEHSTRPSGKYTCSKGDNAKSRVVSEAREHTALVQAHCPSRFRYNPKTSCYQSGQLRGSPFLDTFIVSDTLLRCTSWPGLHGSWVFTGRSR